MQNEVQRGKNIDYVANQLVSANSLTNGGLVQSGDAVVIGNNLVGVASTTALTTADLIDVQHRGVFNLPVSPSGAVAVGNQLYISPTTGVISDTTSGVTFGAALAPVTGGTTASIPVRLKH